MREGRRPPMGRYGGAFGRRAVNRWIAEHREAVLGELEVVSGPYGPQLARKGDWAEAAASLAGGSMELASGSYEERPLPAARKARPPPT